MLDTKGQEHKILQNQVYGSLATCQVKQTSLEMCLLQFLIREKVRYFENGSSPVEVPLPSSVKHRIWDPFLPLSTYLWDPILPTFFCKSPVL